MHKPRKPDKSIIHKRTKHVRRNAKAKTLKKYLFGDDAEPSVGHSVLDEGPRRVASRIASADNHVPEAEPKFIDKFKRKKEKKKKKLSNSKSWNKNWLAILVCEGSDGETPAEGGSGAGESDRWRAPSRAAERDAVPEGRRARQRRHWSSANCGFVKAEKGKRIRVRVQRWKSVVIGYMFNVWFGYDMIWNEPQNIGNRDRFLDRCIYMWRAREKSKTSV